LNRSHVGQISGGEEGKRTERTRQSGNRRDDAEPYNSKKRPGVPKSADAAFRESWDLKTEPAIVPKEILDRYDTNDEEEDADQGLSQI